MDLPRTEESWRGRLHAARRALHERRAKIRKKPALDLGYRVALGIFGGLVLTTGIVLIPYPGPGWLIVFVGLGILATEFAWAHRVNTFAQHQYHRWVAWLQRQHLLTRCTVMAATGLIVLATLWLLGLFAMVGGWFGLHWTWLSSPLFGP